MAQTYTIKPGDTLLNVAQAAGLSVQQLLSANNIDSPNKIMAGDTLVIPDFITGPSLSDEQKNAIAQSQQYVGTHGQGDDVRSYYKNLGLTDDQINTLFQMTAENAEDYDKAVAEQQAAYAAEQEDAPWWQGAKRGRSLVEDQSANTARLQAEKELAANRHFQKATKSQQAELMRRADERVAKQFIDTPNGELIMVRNSKGMPVAAKEVGPNQFMLGHNNLGYAAMVGGRRQMSGLSRTMDPLPLLTYGVHDQVPFVVDQSKIPVNYYRQDLNVENYGSSAFQAAFRKARAAGLPTFQYNGQVFTTNVASDIPTRQVTAMPVVAADGTVAVSPEAAYTVANGQGIVGAGDVYVPDNAGELSGDLVYMVE